MISLFFSFLPFSALPSLVQYWYDFKAKEIDTIFLFGDAKIIGLPCFGSFPTGKHNYSNKKFSHKCEKLVAEEKNVGHHFGVHALTGKILGD